MDESYLLTSGRYVELNPVKACLVEHPQDWRWSSARCRLSPKNDGLTRQEPLQHLVTDWPTFWGSGNEDQMSRIRQYTRTARPLGSETFIEKAEQIAGRVLRRGKPGPKPMSAKATTQQQLDI